MSRPCNNPQRFTDLPVLEDLEEKSASRLCHSVVFESLVGVCVPLTVTIIVSTIPAVAVTSTAHRLSFDTEAAECMISRGIDIDGSPTFSFEAVQGSDIDGTPTFFPFEHLLVGDPWAARHTDTP